MLDPKFVIVGAFFNLFGSLSYVVATLKGKTTPNRVTWFLWALAPLLAFSAQLSKGVGLSSLMTFMVGFGPLMVLSASFINRKSVWKITKFDFTCGVLSILGLLLWALTREGNVAIALSITADAFAALPTIVKSYTSPETEYSQIFLFGAISASITLLTIDNWNFATYGFPLYIFGICLVIFGLVHFKIGDLLRKYKSEILK